MRARAGFGTPHPSLPAALEGRDPLLVEHATWGEGLDLEISLYAGSADLPDELVSSIRCLVTSGDQVLVCAQGRDEASLLPGGRREPGESWQQTAVREVHEETGWQVHPKSLVLLGFLHFRHLSRVPDGHPFPHPDFLQVVFAGEGVPGLADWVDTDDGYVTRSWAVGINEAGELPLTPGDRIFLGLRRSAGSRHT